MAEAQIVVRRTLTQETRVQDRIIWDDTLSIPARFSLIAMLSLRKGWDYSVRGMASMLGLSKDTMSKYIRELEDAGYLKRMQSCGSKGKFSKSKYILTDTPWDFGEEPCPNFSDSAQPCPNSSAPDLSAPEKSPQQNNVIKQQKRIKELTPLHPKGDGRPKRESKYALQEEAKPILREYVGNDRELARALADLIEIREAKGAINSAEAIKRLLKKLDELSGGRRADKLLLIDQSIENSWKSVFPLKSRSGGGASPPGPSTVLEEEGTYAL